MKLKLKEEPREWQKFTAALATLIFLVGFALQKAGVLPGRPWVLLVLCASGVGLCLLRPRWFRPLYRAGMTVSFLFGQVMGAFLLMVFFLALLTPMGWLLRWLGKDLLSLKRNARVTSYWQPAKRNGPFDRQF